MSFLKRKKERHPARLEHLSLRISYDQKKDLRELSESTGMSMGALMRFMLIQFIPRFQEKIGGNYERK